MRRETGLSGQAQAASYGAGTRVGVHRSHFELERVLDRHGATDFAFVETGTSAAIQFAMNGRHVELDLPLPDPNEPHFTHTASGRPRAVSAQERAYEQALREHWRGLLLAVRGKLQSVESGLSTFDDEFRNFLAPHLDDKQTRRTRRKPRAVNWLLGSSHSLAIALVAAFLVPASAVGAFALPPTVVGHLAAPFSRVLPKDFGAPSDEGRALALGQSIWARDEAAPSHGPRPSRSAHRGFAATQPQANESVLDTSPDEVAASDVGLRYSNEPPAAPPAPPGPPLSPGADKPAPQEPVPTPEPPAVPAETTSPSEPSDDPSAATESSDPTAPADAPEPDDVPSTTESPAAQDAPPADEPEGQEAPPADPGNDNGDDGHDNGNHNGADNGNHNGADNGNKNGNDNGNGNGNGKAKGH